jgi:mono/diheme cytochrome c family protein
MQECVTCHGEDLLGVDAGPALVGGAFKSKWDGIALSDMLERVRISMPASSPGKLSRREVADVLAFIFRANEFPEGAAELPSQSVPLRAISFKARR